jgi:hypothetical protein
VALRSARNEFDARLVFLERGHTPQEVALKLPAPPPTRRMPGFPVHPMDDDLTWSAPKWLALPAGLPPVPDDDELEFLAGQALPRQHALGLQAATEAIDIWSLAREQRLGKASESGVHVNFTSFETAGIGPAITAWELFAAKRRALLAALQIERFRVRHSGWPENPEEVSREQRTPFPLDPCGKGNIQFRKNPNGALVYSIGFDGIDNGGNLYRGGVFPLSSFDIGVHLPNPSLRKFVRPGSNVEEPQASRESDRSK